MKYFIPEWNDQVDPEYDFINDKHSKRHRTDSGNDIYLWEVFSIENAPMNGVLVSRVIIAQDRRKYSCALKEGIHKVLRLPKNFEVIGDCGAFGYVKRKIPPYDPIETLKYYSDLGFDYGVSVDHLVVPQFKDEKNFRMRITYENGIRSYNEWLKKYRKDFQLIVPVQGLSIEDYLNMYRNYVKHGITHLAFGGLVRSPTSFIIRLIDILIKEIRSTSIVPHYLHFFGLARFSLFPKFQELEEMGIQVGFDSSSYLRKAWLSSPRSQMNYLTLEGKGYTAIRIPFINNIRKKIGDIRELKRLEQECLMRLRKYDQGKIDLKEVLSILSSFNRKIGAMPELINYYERTLREKPWRKCDCPICKDLGIEVIIFRGNNRNRRRGFHNTYVFYKALKNPSLWTKFIKSNKENNILLNIDKGQRVLVITSCTKKKLGYDSSIKAPAKYMYRGKMFLTVKKYCESMGFDYVIISAKYGLVYPDEIIEGYDKVLKNESDVRRIQSLVEERLRPLIKRYDKIIVIASKMYRKVLENLWDERFMIVSGKGYADICNIINKTLSRERQRKMLDYIK